MKSFAVRLGVSVRTVQRYHASDPNFRRETICDAQKITWYNVDTAIPDIPPHPGCFLLDEKGKHYPLKIPIAKKLLAARQPVWYMRQRPNAWSYGEWKGPLFSELEASLRVDIKPTTKPPDDRHPLFALCPEEEIPERAVGIVVPPVAAASPEDPLHLAGIRVMHYTRQSIHSGWSAWLCV